MLALAPRSTPRTGSNHLRYSSVEARCCPSRIRQLFSPATNNNQITTTTLHDICPTLHDIPGISFHLAQRHYCRKVHRSGSPSNKHKRSSIRSNHQPPHAAAAEPREAAPLPYLSASFACKLDKLQHLSHRTFSILLLPAPKHARYWFDHRRLPLLTFRPKSASRVI